MTSKINVTENIVIAISKNKISVDTILDYDISVTFDNKDAQPTLDENGDLFEPVFKCRVKAKPKREVSFGSLTRVKNNIKDLQEIKKFYEFVLDNKNNLFEMAGFKGALE